MIFRQLFDSESSTYTYLIASRRGGEALIIDPVLDRVDRYIQLLDELDLRLIKAADTHVQDFGANTGAFLIHQGLQASRINAIKFRDAVSRRNRIAEYDNAAHAFWF